MTAAGRTPFSLYPELDATALGAFVGALESGDLTGLAPARAAEVAEARSLAVFTRGKVTGADGDLLDAAMWRHTGVQPRPVIVMPSPWTDLGWLAYAVQATLFASRGYNVLAYTTRGFAASEGQVDVAGPLDVADGSRALDHLIERSTGPVTKIGFLGDSYGSGISQLVAAHDTRVDAVVALSSWGDLGEAFYENSTRHVAAVRALLDAAGRARLSPQTRSVFDNVLADRDIRGTLSWAEPRSPFSHIKELNRRQVPVFFSHAWHETLFPSNQTLKMFNELTGPKRLALSIGDHSGPEAPGMFGLPNRIWTDAHRWFDRHLKGIDNGIDAEGQVLNEVMWSKTLEPRPTWHSVTEEVHRLHLAGGGELTEEPEAGWTAGVLCGVDTPATVADSVVTSGYPEIAGESEGLPHGRHRPHRRRRVGRGPRPRDHPAAGYAPPARHVPGGEPRLHLRRVPPGRGARRHRPHRHARPVHRPRLPAGQPDQRGHRPPGHGVRRPARPPPDAGDRRPRPLLRRRKPPAGDPVVHLAGDDAFVPGPAARIAQAQEVRPPGRSPRVGGAGASEGAWSC